VNDGAPSLLLPGVYALVDDRLPHKIKYIGSSRRSLLARLKQYANPNSGACGERLKRWLVQTPDHFQMVPLENVEPGPELKKAEQQWIAFARLFGPTLNTQQGCLLGTNRLGKEFSWQYSSTLFQPVQFLGR